jgi:hypothetical protein
MTGAGAAVPSPAPDIDAAQTQAHQHNEPLPPAARAQHAALSTQVVRQARQQPPLSATDPTAGAKLAAAQGHPLTAAQRVALGEAQGKTTPLQAHQQLVEAGALPAFKPVLDSGGWFAKLADELAGVGPGLAKQAYNVGKGLVEDTAQAVEHPGNANIGATAKAVDPIAHGIVHSFGETIHHPGRQFNEDPLGFLTNTLGSIAPVGSVAGRAGAIADAARAADLSGLAKAAIKTPAPVERTLNIGGGETVHPLGSINHSVGLIQKHVIDPVTQHALDHPNGRLAQLLNGPVTGRFIGPAVKVGRELRAQERVRTAQAPGKTIGDFGQATPAGKVARLGRASSKLSAAQAKAVMIHASGRTPEEWAQLEQHAIEQGLGNPDAHAVQLGLTKQAATYLDPGNVHPLVEQAANVFRGAIGAREKALEMQPEDVYHRLGAHSFAIEHGANGFVGEHPAETVARLQTEIGRRNGYTPAPGVSLARVRADTEQKLADNLKLQDQLGETRPLTTDALALRNKLADIADHEQITQLHAQMVAEGKRVHEAGGFYIKMQPESKPLARLTSLIGSRRNQYGMGAVRAPKTHAYEGGMLMRGDYRTNVAALTGRAFHEAQSLEAAKRVRETLYAMGKQAPEEAGGEHFAEAIRPTSAVSESLKAATNQIDKGGVRAGENPALSDLINSWYDHTKASPGEDVRYVDKRTLAPLRPYEPILGKAGELVDRGNQIVRIGRYLLPRYLQWLPQNIGFTLPRQGVFMVRNLVKYKTEFPKLDAGVRDRIYSVMGAGPSHGLQGDSAFLAGPQAHLAEFWNKVNDAGPRALAWIHEAETAGFHNAAGYTRLATDPRFERQFIAVTRRANKEAGDYQISNAERATLKKLVPSWAWDKAASQWVGRLLIEHPYVSQLLAESGREGKQQVDAFFQNIGGMLPSWLQGVLPLNAHRGLDTSGIVATDTPAQLLEGARGLAPGATTGRGQLASQLAPIPTFALDTLLGQTKYGTKDTTGLAPVTQLAKSFQPGGIVYEGLHPGGTFGGGWEDAGLRALGFPVEHIDFQRASKSGLTEYLNTLGSGPRAQFKALRTLQEIPSKLVLLEKRGVHLPIEFVQGLRTGIQREAARQQAFASAAAHAGVKVGHLASVDRLKVTVIEAEKYGLATDEAQQILAAAGQLDDRQLAQLEARVWAGFGNTAYVHAWQRVTTPPKRTAAVTK